MAKMIIKAVLTARDENRIAGILRRGDYDIRTTAIIRQAYRQGVEVDILKLFTITEDGTRDQKYNAGQILQLIYAYEAGMPLNLIMNTRFTAGDMEILRKAWSEEQEKLLKTA